MNILTSAQIRQLEASANLSGIPMEQLMDRAGMALAEQVKSHSVCGDKIVIVCGKGNNGGDGLICAELLSHNYKVTAVLIHGTPKTTLAKRAWEQLSELVSVVLNVETDRDLTNACEGADLIIDCIFGFGFQGNLSAEDEQSIKILNLATALKIAADLPSGVACDTAKVSSIAFQADITVTFNALKPATVSYPALAFCGQVVLEKLIITDYISSQPSFFLTDSDYISLHLPNRSGALNKGDFGNLLCICGSTGMAGACIMAANAALRSGVGIVTIVTEKELYPILAPSIPEAVFKVLPPEKEERESSLLAALNQSSACLIGCGLGNKSDGLCDFVIKHCEVPLLLDADAINFLARNPSVWQKRHPNGTYVLTPHPGELSRLKKQSIASIQASRIEAAQDTANTWDAVTLLKGAATVVASPEGEVAVNPTGNAGMAKGGSGDVLSGVIASFMAQGIKPFEATVCGAYIHGESGDLCAKKQGMRAMLPTDMIKKLSHVFRRFEKMIKSKKL